MKRIVLFALAGMFCVLPLGAATEVHDRVVRGAIVLREIAAAPDNGIPQDLLDRSACVAVIPGLKKGGFIFGAAYGKGLMSCRLDNGAGPVGRTASAETDAWMSAEILAYARSRGLFGGLTVKGSAVRPDRDANHVLYGREMKPRSLLLYRTDPVPRDAEIFLDELNRMSPPKAAR